jgi:hypothetical protein
METLSIQEAAALRHSQLQAQASAILASRQDERNSRDRDLQWPDPLKLSGAATVADLEEQSQVFSPPIRMFSSNDVVVCLRSGDGTFVNGATPKSTLVVYCIARLQWIKMLF